MNATALLIISALEVISFTGIRCFLFFIMLALLWEKMPASRLCVRVSVAISSRSVSVTNQAYKISSVGRNQLLDQGCRFNNATSYVAKRRKTLGKK